MVSFLEGQSFFKNDFFLFYKHRRENFLKVEVKYIISEYSTLSCLHIFSNMSGYAKE